MPRSSRSLLVFCALCLSPFALGQDQAPPRPPFPAPRLWKEYPGGGEIASVSPDGKVVAVVAGMRGRTPFHWVFVYDRVSGKERYRFPSRNGPSGNGGTVAFTPDGKRLVSVQERRPFNRIQQYDVRVTDAATGKPVRLIPLRDGQHIHEHRHYAVSNTVLVVAGTKEAATVYDLATGKALGDLPADLPEPLRRGAMALSPDGRWLVATTSRKDNLGLSSGEIHLWDVRKLSYVGKIHVHKSRIRGLAISPDGASCAFTAFADPRIYVIDRETSAEKARCDVVFHAPNASRLRFTADGKTLVAGGIGPNHGLVFWDWKTSKEMRGGFPKGAKKIRHGPLGEEARKAWRWGDIPDFGMSGDGKVIVFMPAEGKLYLVDLTPSPEPPSPEPPAEK